MNAQVHTEAMTATQRASLAYTLHRLGEDRTGTDKDSEEDDNV